MVYFTPTGAEATCLGEGKRLPSVAERQQAVLNGKVPTTAAEWTSSVDGGGFATAIVAGGAGFPSSVGAATAFRCALAPTG